MPLPPEDDLKLQIQDMMDREILGATGGRRPSVLERAQDPNWSPLDDISQWANIEVPPRAIVHAHFQVTVYRRQWMADGSVIHWIPLSVLSLIEWRKFRDDTPRHGLAHQLGVAAHTGLTLTITDPYTQR